VTRGPVLLFAGPSLPHPLPPLPAGVELRPPARCGDLLRAAAERPAAVALVDGLFETAASVWHKEILALLDAGTPVFGAASIGALRAAELDRYGMIGVGAIYRAYRDGRIDEDAAVMVSHAPAELGHRPLTLALVDAEASLAASDMTEGERRALLAIARRLNFRERDWPGILGLYAERSGEEAAARVTAAIAASAFSQKARDVVELIERLREPAPTPKANAFPRTSFFHRLRDRIERERESAPSALPA
jgi:hypothetical protein